MFKSKDIVCFLGDSITSNGRWVAEVYQNLRHKRPIKCYNCGISGGTTNKAVEYLYEKCLNYNPDTVVMMFGINDIGHWLYTKENRELSNHKTLTDNAFASHKETYDILIKKILDFGSDIILCTPVPYDEINDYGTFNNGCMARLSEAREYQLELAKKYNLPVVDFFKEFLPIMESRRLYNPDRIHPTEDGQHAMAQIFLKAMGETDDIDLDTPFVFEPWNEKRYLAENCFRAIYYVEYCDMFYVGWLKNLTYEEKIKIAKERYESFPDKTQGIPTFYKKYIEDFDKLTRYEAKVVELTIF